MELLTDTDSEHPLHYNLIKKNVGMEGYGAVGKDKPMHVSKILNCVANSVRGGPSWKTLVERSHYPLFSIRLLFIMHSLTLIVPICHVMCSRIQYLLPHFLATEK